MAPRRFEAVKTAKKFFSTTQTVVDGVVGRAYKRGPSAAGAAGDGCLRLWRRGKGCADGGRGAVNLFARDCERLAAYIGRASSTGDELESLILAQNERWRHA